MEPKQGTHWEGCYEVHPECAAYKAGFRAGMRAAAERLTELMPGQQTAYVLRNAILAEADKP